MKESEIETKINEKGLTAPRVTPADIEANIVCEYYFTGSDAIMWEAFQRQRSGEEPQPGVCFHKSGTISMPTPLGLLTFCVLILRNGFTVTGESACARPENFNAELCRKTARQNAISKVLPLIG